MGHKRGQNVTRPIVAKFVQFKDREVVRKAAPTALRGTNFGINEQFLKEVNNKRKKFYPYLKQAKDQKKIAVLVYDKLYIDGQLFVQEEIQNTQRMYTQKTSKPTKRKNAQQSETVRDPCNKEEQTDQPISETTSRTTMAVNKVTI